MSMEMGTGLGGMERFASAKSLREALSHAPDDSLVLVNRVGNLNVYDKDGEWLAIISMVNVDLHNSHSPDEEPVAEWEPIT